MKVTLLKFAKLMAKFIYFFLKLLPIQNKVVLISRINKKSSIEFILLKEKIQEKNPKTKVKVLNHKLKSKPHIIIDVLKEMYHLATSSGAIIDSYIIPVSILKHKKKLIIIQIWHATGVSKKFGFTALGLKEGAKLEIAKVMNMHQNYNYVIASGENAIKYYEESFNIERNKILNLGLPRIDYLLNNNNRNKVKENFYYKYPKLKTKQNILYAPTFRKGKKIKYQNIINEIDFNKYNLIIKQHHLDKSIIIDDRTINLSNESVLDLLFITDYLITDYSALMFEAAIVEIPMFFYIYDINSYEERRGLTINLKKDAPGFTSYKANEIIKAISTNNYDIQKIKDFRKKHIDNLDGLASERIVNLLNLGSVKNEVQNKKTFN